MFGFGSFRAWRLPRAPRTVRFVHTTVRRICVCVLLIMPTVPDRALLLLVTRFQCFCRRLAFRTKHRDFFFYSGAIALFGVSLLIVRDSRSHSDTPHSVGLLWTSDQPDAETSVWQHTIRTRDILALGGIRTHKSQQASGRRPTP